MKINKQSIKDLITRANSRPHENLALVGERYQTVREVQWPAIRRLVVQFSRSTPYQAIRNFEMSVIFRNGSKLQCFSADRSNQMHGHFTDILILEEITESEQISLIETGVIPPRYVPPSQPGIQPMIGPPQPKKILKRCNGAFWGNLPNCRVIYPFFQDNFSVVHMKNVTG